MFIGIDPGKTGGICILDDNGKVLTLAAMPINGDELDVQAICRLISCPASVEACAIERVGAMPGQGLSSTFRFGFGTGMLHGIIRTLGIPLEVASPQVWQKSFGGLNGGDKSHTAAHAARLFPGLDLRASPRCKKPHEGMVDALGIATWLYNKHRGAK